MFLRVSMKCNILVNTTIKHNFCLLMTIFSLSFHSKLGWWHPIQQFLLTFKGSAESDQWSNMFYLFCSHFFDVQNRFSEQHLTSSYIHYVQVTTTFHWKHVQLWHWDGGTLQYKSSLPLKTILKIRLVFQCWILSCDYKAKFSVVFWKLLLWIEDDCSFWSSSKTDLQWTQQNRSVSFPVTMLSTAQ